MNSVHIIIYEDDDRYRNSLSQLVAGSAGLNLVGAFPDCRGIVGQIGLLRPDIALMDIEMPHVGGIEGMGLAKAAFPDLKILILTHHDDDEKIFDALLRGGADGYLLKNSTPEKIREAVGDVLAGGSVMSPYIASRALKMLAPAAQSPLLSFFKKEKNDRAIRLTDSELRVLQWLSKGHSYKMVAAELFISINTVKNHLKKIYQKMQVHSAPEAVAKAIREKIV